MEKYFHKKYDKEVFNPTEKSVRILKSGKFSASDHFFAETAAGTTFPFSMEDIEIC